MTTLDVLADDATNTAAESENRHMKATIAALRQALEDAEAERNAVRQSVRVACEDEITELKATITALRDALEEARHEGGAAVNVPSRVQPTRSRSCARPQRRSAARSRTCARTTARRSNA